MCPFDPGLPQLVRLSNDVAPAFLPSNIRHFGTVVKVVPVILLKHIQIVIDKVSEQTCLIYISVMSVDVLLQSYFIIIYFRFSTPSISTLTLKLLGNH